MYTDKNNGGRNAGVSLELDILSKPEVCVIAGELYACYQWSCIKTINLYPLEFDNSGGKNVWIYGTLLLKSLWSVQKYWELKGRCWVFKGPLHGAKQGVWVWLCSFIYYLLPKLESEDEGWWFVVDTGFGD